MGMKVRIASKNSVSNVCTSLQRGCHTYCQES